MKRVHWHIPTAAGVGVWLSVSSTRDKLGFQVSQRGVGTGDVEFWVPHAMPSLNH